MKLKTLIMSGVCALLFGAGASVSMAQVYDFRCQSCQTNFEACIARCDNTDPDNIACYTTCVQKKKACTAIFCRGGA